jgi:hypothetical protein
MSNAENFSINPLTISEMQMICEALKWAQSEIHNPGACRNARIDINERIADAIYRLSDAIERPMVAA